jgi:hypothetical protein
MLIEPITKGGRLFSVEEITYAIKIVRQFSSFPQRELADTLCEHWSWFTATGSYKTHACLMLLRDLESKKLISLQPLVAYVKKQSSETQIVHVRTQNSPIACDLKTLGSVVLVLADDKKQRALFNEYLAEHHYLGYKKPFGAVLRYFIMNGAHILGCVLIASAAKAISARDRWIGWDKEHRVSNLPWVINNTRFLIFLGLTSLIWQATYWVSLLNKFARISLSTGITPLFYWRHLLILLNIVEPATRPRIGFIWGKQQAAVIISQVSPIKQPQK